MDFFKKLVFAKEIASKRIKQIDDENIIDQMVQKEYQKCPNVINDFIFKTRKINRIHSRELYTSSFFEYPTIIEKNLSTVDNFQSKILHTKDLCSDIPKILRELEKM